MENKSYQSLRIRNKNFYTQNNDLKCINCIIKETNQQKLEQEVILLKDQLKEKNKELC